MAGELVEAALKRKGADPDYKLLVAEDGAGTPAGYICYGPSPMTSGTWDVYWIVVSPAARRRGLGMKLLEAAQKAAKARRGRRFVIDTSSQRSYGPARALYERAGFRPACTVPDYYRKGWHRITYFKNL